MSLVALRELIETKEESMEYEVRLKEVGAQHIAGIRTQCGPNEIGKVYGEVVGRVFAHIGKAGVAGVGPPLAIYHRYDEEGVDMSVAVPVGGLVPEGDGVTAGELPAGLMAMTVHVGSYQTIGKAWEALTAWVQQHGHEQADPCYESYLTDPGAEKDPAKYVTEVYCAVKS